jgi:transposase
MAANSKSAQIREMLQAAPAKSAAEIAKEVGVSAALVYNVKSSMTKKRGKAGKKKAGPKKGEVNKAQRIRDVAKSLGKTVRPRDVIAVLAKEGIKVSSPQVSKTLRNAGYRRKRRGKRTATAAGAKATRGLNMESLLAAKALIEKSGSVEAAQEALAALKKLT